MPSDFGTAQQASTQDRIRDRHDAERWKALLTARIRDLASIETAVDTGSAVETEFSSALSRNWPTTTFGVFLVGSVATSPRHQNKEGEAFRPPPPISLP